MPTVVITLRDGLDLAVEMARIRNWFDLRHGTALAFKYRHDGQSMVLEIEVDSPETARRFKDSFGGYDGFSSTYARAFLHETMETVCWWRLRAEEIRVESEEYRSRDARKTMAEVALSYDRMADNLEKRLTDPRYRTGLIVSEGSSRA
jgi:hypothetical protein